MADRKASKHKVKHTKKTKFWKSNWQLKYVAILLIAVVGTVYLVRSRAATACPSGGITLNPGANIQSEINARGTGTTFCISGVHTGQTIQPKANDVFIGINGGTLDGGTTVERAVISTANNVTLRDLEIRYYKSRLQHGAITGDDDGGTGWLLDNLNVHNNYSAGVGIGSSWKMQGGRVHHNGQIGLKASSTTNAIYDGVEVDHNHVDPGVPAWNWDPNVQGGNLAETGGSKFSETTGIIVRNNYVHDNDGPGLWTDIDNFNSLYENNKVEYNSASGIFHEISYDAIIRNNIVRFNSQSGGSWGYGGGIQISASQNVQVYGNYLERNGRGVTLIMQSRGTGNRGLHEIANNSIHDNVIISDQSGQYASMLAQDVGNKAYFTTKNNKFYDNKYYLGTAKTTWFSWDDGDRTAAEWRNYGNDNGPNAVFSTLANAPAVPAWPSGTSPPPPPPTPIPPPPPTPVTIPFLINAAGPAVNYAGANWVADQYANGGTAYTCVTTACANGTVTGIYQTERYWTASSGSYSIPIANGTYKVRIHEMEVWDPNMSTGARVFDLKAADGNINFATNADGHVDVFRDAGGGNRYKIYEKQVTVGDGSLDINLTPVVGDPRISGIEVISTTATGVTPPSPPSSDTTPPTVSFNFTGFSTQPVDNAVVTDKRTVSMTISSSDASGISSTTATINGSATTISNNSITTPNANGNYTISVTVKDNANNTTTKTQTILIRHRDFSRNGVVDLLDLSMLNKAWNTASDVYDFNNTSTTRLVDLYDLSFLMQGWGSTQ